MVAAIILILFALTGVGFYPVMLRQNRREIVFYGVIWVCSLTILLLYNFNINLPDPAMLLMQAMPTWFVSP